MAAPVAVNTTEDYYQWFQQLTPREQQEVLYVVHLLQAFGVGLARPHSGSLGGTKLPLRELRPSAGRSPLRIVYALDPRREAILLIGGDKGGDKKMYQRIIPIAEKLWREHIDEVRAELAHETKSNAPEKK